MPSIYDDNIIYAERYNFDFLLNKNSENWFISGTSGLWMLTTYLIACYTPERRLNFLNDLNEFILNHYIQVFGIHGKNLERLRETDKDYNGINLCLASVYRTDDKMRNDICAALLKFLEIIDLRSYYERNVLESGSVDIITSEDYKRSRSDVYYKRSVIEIYNRLSTCLYGSHPLIKGNFAIDNIHRLVGLIESGVDLNTVIVEYDTTTRTTIVTPKPNESVEDFSKEIAMFSYQCAHEIMCSM